MAKVGALLKPLLHPSYTAFMNGENDAIVYLIAHITNHFKANLLDGTLHSLVDNFRMRNKCRQKEGVTLGPRYLSHEFFNFLQMVG